MPSKLGKKEFQPSGKNKKTASAKPKEKHISAKCYATIDANHAALHSPSFVYRLKTSDGLQAQSWENRLAGYAIPLSGSEVELDVDAAEQRIWITEWKNWRGKVPDANSSAPDKEDGYRQGFALPDFDDQKWGNFGEWGFHFLAPRQDIDKKYYWARTHVFLPVAAKDKDLSLTLGGFGLYDYRYLRVFINGQEVGVRHALNRWHEPGVFNIGPKTAIHKHLRFGQDNIIAMQATGGMVRTERMNELDPRQARDLPSTIYWWPGQFEQYLTIGKPWHTPDLKIINVNTAQEGDCGKVVFELKSEAPKILLSVTYQWNATDPVLHKFMEIRNKSGQEIRLMHVRLGKYKTDNELKISDGEQGFPVYLNKDFFLSVAHPSGWAIGQPGQITLCQYPGEKISAGESFTCMETVLGTARPGEARQLFLAHIQSRSRRVLRKHNKAYAIYEPFGAKQKEHEDDNETNEIFNETEEFIIDNIAKVTEGQRETGCHFDFYLIDFWVDYYGDLQRFDRRRFPSGLARINPKLRELGTFPGLWIGSSGCYEWDIGGNPVIANCSIVPAPGTKTFCRASEPVKTMFSSAFKHHLRENGVRLCKFDSFAGICYNFQHNHLPGVYSTEAIQSSFIEFLRDLDAECPDVFLMLYWGFRSPWWLVHADTLFDPGLQMEAAHPTSFPTLHARDGVTVGLDQAQWWCEDIPPLGKDSLGVWLSDWKWNCSIGKERWQEGFVMDICRGSLLAQPWSDYHWLSPDERNQMAEFIALLKARPECFGNPRFILGNPWKYEPYGYSCSDGNRAFIALNNCTWSDHAVKLELNSKWGLADDRQWDIYRWYPDPAKLEGVRNSLSLRPFEVVLLEVVPAGKQPSLSKKFTVKPISGKAFSEPSRQLALSVSTPENVKALTVPCEEDKSVSVNVPPLPPKRVLVIKGEVPVCKNGGNLVVSVEMLKNSCALMTAHIGTYFAVQGRLSGQVLECYPIFKHKTHPVNWQGWRISVKPAEISRNFELIVTVMAEQDVELSVKGHFIPN